MYEEKRILDDALFAAGLELEMDEYCCGELNGKPFRFSENGWDFCLDDDFDRWALAEYVTFDVRTKKGLRGLIRYVSSKGNF